MNNYLHQEETNNSKDSIIYNFRSHIYRNDPSEIKDFSIRKIDSSEDLENIFNIYENQIPKQKESIYLDLYDKIGIYI